MSIEQRLNELGLELTQPMSTAALPFDLARADGDHLYVSGHVPTDLGGSLQAYLGDLNRVIKWLRVFGMVNTAPGFSKIPGVINGCFDRVLQIFDPDVGAHARSTVGMAELPFNVPVEIEAEVKIQS